MKTLTRLHEVLARHDGLAVAVSGGVDSMTLAHVAHGLGQATMIHAISPAVPMEATARVRRHAVEAGWSLRLVDAGEFGDPRYRANPVDRCYFCKLNLYGTVRRLVQGAVASGTNTDDLGDFRPGLQAADELGVCHPYVEAGIGKAEIYDLASALGFDDLAELPAQPCLASRIETRIPVQEKDLAFVEAVEQRLHHLLGTGSVLRCRITAAGVILELAAEHLDAEGIVADLCAEAGRPFLGARPYRRGAAFLHGTPA